MMKLLTLQLMLNQHKLPCKYFRHSMMALMPGPL